MLELDSSQPLCPPGLYQGGEGVFQFSARSQHSQHDKGQKSVSFLRDWVGSPVEI